MAALVGASSVTITDRPGGGILETLWENAQRAAFDRVLVSDCLWMPDQHDNLRRSMSHFLKETAAARACVVAGFHAEGRSTLRAF